MPTTQDVLNALSKIIDPDFNKDIVSLGFVKNIQIHQREVSLDIELTTPACPIKDEFQRQANELLLKIGFESASIQMTSRARPLQEKSPMANQFKNVKTIIAVSSCKGGVGKSTVAAILALELAARGFKVGLLDADIYGPSVPTLFGLTGFLVKVNQAQQLIPARKDGLALMSFGFLLGDAPAVLRGPIVSRYIQQLIFQTAWEELDYLLIDMPPGTGDIQLTITQSIMITGAVIVTTRQSLSLVDVARGILMFERVNVPILGVIENMSYLECDACHKKHYIFGEQSTMNLEERFGVKILGELPLMSTLSQKVVTRQTAPIIKNLVDTFIRALGKIILSAKDIPQINFNDTTIELQFKDQEKLVVQNLELRLSCRCALCVNEITGEVLIKKDQIKQGIQAKQIFPLGNYAIGINWSDGHQSGIYPYAMIRQLAKSNQT